MDDDPPDRDPEPFGARPGESERSDPPRDDDPGEIDDDGDGWGSEVAIALALVGGVLLLAGLLFVGLGGFGTDAGEESGDTPVPVNDTTNETNASEDVQEDDVENDTEPAAGDEPEPAPEEPEPEPAPEEPEEPTNDSEPEPDPEPEPEPEPNETEPGPEQNETEVNETEPGNETGNGTNETDPQPGATAVIQVVDQAGDPVEGEPVTLIAMDGSESTRTTDENGEVVIELVAGDASDVARFDVRVRDQEQVVYIQRDDVHGVQELVFEVGESDPSGNETNETNETVAVTMEVGL